MMLNYSEFLFFKTPPDIKALTSQGPITCLAAENSLCVCVCVCAREQKHNLDLDTKPEDGSEEDEDSEGGTIEEEEEEVDAVLVWRSRPPCCWCDGSTLTTRDHWRPSVCPEPHTLLLPASLEVFSSSSAAPTGNTLSFSQEPSEFSRQQDVRVEAAHLFLFCG